MEEVDGVAYVNPNNDNEWLSQPYPEQVKHIRVNIPLMMYTSKYKIKRAV